MILTAPFDTLVDVSDQALAPDTPHPVMGCRCGEGRVVSEYASRVIRHWLPPVHDCAYIRERNGKLGLP